MRFFGLASLLALSGQLLAHIQQPCCWSGALVHTAIRKIFPMEWLDDFKLPPLEGITNGNELSAWRGYVYNEGLEDPALLPHRYSNGYQSLSEGRQRGAVGPQGAIDPRVGYGGPLQEHFDTAVSLVENQGGPWEVGVTVAQDLRYAAVRAVTHAKRIRKHRKKWGGLVRR